MNYSYSYVGDLVVIVLCLVLLFTMKMTYSPRNRRLVYVKISLVNLVYISVLSIMFYAYMLPNVKEINMYLVYTVHNALQIGLITELGLFIFYVFDLVNYRKLWSNIAIDALTLIFYLLELISVKTKIGFHIENGVVYQSAISNLYFIWYVMFMSIFTVVVFRCNKIVVDRIYISVFGVLGVCELIMSWQYLTNTETYTTLTYFLPVVVIIFLFHSNSYNSNFGALDRASLRSRLAYLSKKGIDYDFVYVQITNFTSIEHLPKTSEDFKYFMKELNYKDYLFRYDDNTFIMIFKQGAMLDKLRGSFSVLHENYNLGHKIIVVSNNVVCNSLLDYTSLCSIFLGKVTNSVYKVNEKDLEYFRKSKIVKAALIDIEGKHDLDDSRVKVYCQPILNISRGRFTTAESLMRMELDDLGMLYPDLFIPIAESEGRIHILTMIILNKVCQYIVKNPEIERISVNFSMYEITRANFYEDIIDIISRYPIEYSKLGFEVTESLEAEDFSEISKILQRFRDLGIKIYLDDFGTGYSNIEHLTRLPIDIIKFDRSLVISSGQDSVSGSMIRSISDIFSTIGYSILYEGIESEDDQSRCVEMKAEYLQGYRYSKPVPIEELGRFVNKTYEEVQG